MNILTDEEINDLTGAAFDDHAWEGTTAMSVALARAIEAAVIKRLAAGVSVEPAATMQTYPDGRRRVLLKGSVADCDAQWQTTHILYTATAIAAARVQENERCAKLIEDEEEDGLPLETLANGIRSSLGNSVSFETCYSPTPARREE